MLQLGRGADKKAAAAAAAAAERRPPGKGRLRSRLPPIAAVEVDAPGCSFNPEPEAHQDALAAYVAAHVRRDIAKDLAPRPPPALLLSSNGSGGGAANGGLNAERDPVLALLSAGVEALPEAEGDEDEAGSGSGSGSGEEEGGGGGGKQRRHAAAKQQQQQDPNDIDLGDGGGEAAAAEEEADDDDDEEGDAAAAAAARRAAGAKKTTAERNREARRRAQEAEAAARAALKKRRRELEALDAVEAALAEEEAARAARRARRDVIAAERAATLPPRLGKHKFVPTPAPVLTSDEVTGSLRQLAPYPMVAAERYRALQKRGLIEVRKPAGERKKARLGEHVTGERFDKAAARQAEVDALKRGNVKAARKARRAAAAAGGGGSVLGVVSDADLAAATMDW